MPSTLESRRADSTGRLEELRKDLTQAAKLVERRACIYVTGSFGRGEASSHSDLDLFIASRAKKREKKSELSPLREIRVKADLIIATENHGIPEFSAGGQYLTHYRIDELIDTLGKPEDDSSNTFTARLLLLLESQPLLGADVYSEAVGMVVESYWRDFDRHKTDFMPSFLANDILRLWRTFCVNYEARTKKGTEIEKAKRRLKNFKLKHSRLLTCYSGIVYLLSISVLNKTVTQQDAISMTGMTPTQRLEWIASERRLSAGHRSIRQILQLYEKFLEQSGEPEEKLISRFRVDEDARTMFQQADELGERICELLAAIGSGKSPLYRHLIV